MLDEGIEQSDEVRDKLSHLAQEKASLLSLWEERRILYEQCMDLQLFYRDTEQVITIINFFSPYMQKMIFYVHFFYELAVAKDGYTIFISL